MRYTLGDLLPHLAPFADGGLCADDVGGPSGTNRVVLRINEAVERLVKKLGQKGLIRCVRMCGYNGCLTVPRDIRKILKARVDGYFANVFDKWYEYLDAGPGMLDDDSTSYIDLIDRGNVCTQYDPPEPLRLMVFSDTAEDVNAKMLIRGFDETNREVRTEINGVWNMGEYVPITRDIGYFTQHKFSVITSIMKPVTNGYVYLSAVDADDWTDIHSFTREFLAGYHPDETRPDYRRYSFKTTAYQTLEDAKYRVNAIVKMDAIPLSRTTDVCIISNLPAIKMMMQAMRAYDTGDAAKGLEYERHAERLVLEDTEDYETVQAIADIQIQGWGQEIEHV